ncbi:hypothetical protein [Brucella anthropi]|uniref:hypothetical protein n=1 Tax=Brucella anthropi TaxID=529 RepID=UPI0002884ECE|nr:hypothetical protein [Brucella anthropi]
MPQSSNSKHHPDSHALDDWQLYGPRDGEMFQLICRLAYDHNLRLIDIEQLMVTTLKNKLVELE